MLRSARHFSCTGIKVLTLHFYFEQIAVTITDKFSSIKAESPEMSRTIMAVINEAGGGREGGGGGGAGGNAVVSYQFNVKFIRVVPSTLTFPFIDLFDFLSILNLLLCASTVISSHDCFHLHSL